ncbi:uncharacterized protein LOC132548418 [Ylistrum balloti]|uniref:uncharacterized protein LOC132548418 n=1 Tax=Ylistrum balloti TaxID=509963 RepID=UPI002905917B|nr:uncharacterized protein LOC132548418 [Ylistrum balloti]
MVQSDYLPTEEPQTHDAVVEAKKRDMAARFGGSYLAPGKIYRDSSDISSKDKMIQKILDDAEKEDHKKITEAMMKGAVDMRSMSQGDRILTSMKLNPLVPLGLAGSIITMLVGVRAASKGQVEKSYRLMNVRFGFGLMTAVALFGWLRVQKLVYQDRLRIVKQELLKELGEDEDSLNL